MAPDGVDGAEILSAPIRLGAQRSMNRIAMAPMTNKQSHDDGTLSRAETDWLGMRANGGFGVVITGGWPARGGPPSTPAELAHKPVGGRRTLPKHADGRADAQLGRLDAIAPRSDSRCRIAACVRLCSPSFESRPET